MKKRITSKKNIKENRVRQHGNHQNRTSTSRNISEKKKNDVRRSKRRVDCRRNVKKILYFVLLVHSFTKEKRKQDAI